MKKISNEQKKELCISCKEKPVRYYKWKLCAACYQHKRVIAMQEKEGKEAVINYRYIKHEAEMEFIKNYFNHNNWIYEPASFRLSDSTYTPDFYDGEKNIFIEVAGSRQAYNFNKDKYFEFKKRYPKIILEVYKDNGEIYKNIEIE